MNINIPDILQRGEGISIEFKKAKNKIPENLFDTVCAFLNHNGGTILLGVTDDGTVEGIDADVIQQMKKDIATLSNNPQKLFPAFLFDLQDLEFEGKLLIHFFVPSSSQVHNSSGKMFDRNEDGDFVLKSSEQIKSLYIRKNNLYSENTIYPYLYETDFVPGIVDRVRKKISINRPDHPWNDLSSMDFYKIAGLYRKDIATNAEGFTMAALLLFGRDEVIMGAIPHYKIDALLRINDLDRYDDRENIKCNLVDAYDRLMAFTAKHLPDKFYLQGDMRISLREKIFREIIANLLMHREYTNAYPSAFVIYRDRVETKNANKPRLYGQLLPGNFEPFPKNPHLIQMFTQMGRSEELGTGIRNVYKYTKFYSGEDSIDFEEQDIFISQVPLGDIFTSKKNDNQEHDVERTNQNKVGDKVGDKLTENQRKILTSISENPCITASELASVVGISKRKIEENIAKLKAKGLLDRIGADNGGYWQVKRVVEEVNDFKKEKI
jgi:ATP-dependent DNA helicase RecG